MKAGTKKKPIIKTLNQYRVTPWMLLTAFSVLASLLLILIVAAFMGHVISGAVVDTVVMIISLWFVKQSKNDPEYILVWLSARILPKRLDPGKVNE